MENKFSEKYFQLTVCFSGFDPEIGFSQNFHFKPFPDSRAKREREREEEERAQSSDRAPVRRPQTELQFDDPHSTGLVDCSTAPIKQRSTLTPLDLASAARSRLHIRHAISPLDRTQSPLSLPSSLNLTGFDEFFFRFFSFCVSVLRNVIIYLFGS